MNLPEIVYAREDRLDPAEFLEVLQRSGLAQRRPVEDPARVARMVAGGNLMISAREGGRLVGVARSLTDFAFCCYLSDLAVDKACQGRGIGRRLIEETRRAAGPEAACMLISAPGAVAFYEAIGMPRCETAFLYPREA